MELRQVEGKDIHDALERTRSALGDQAVVVSHRRTQDGRVVLAVSDEVPRSVQALEALRARARDVLAAGGGPVRSRTTGLADVERCLRRSGASVELVDEILRETSRRLDAQHHPLDVAAEVLGAAFPVARAHIEAHVTRVLALVGPTGAGKTTSAAKLARGLARAGRRVAVASLDRTLTSDPLRSYADLLRVPYVDVAWLDDVQAGSAEDALLLDSSGDYRQSITDLEALNEGLAGRPLRLDTYLVLPASANVQTLEDLALTASGLAPAGCIITKLDEVGLRVPILELARRLELPIAFLSDGAGYRGRFHRATPDRFADLCLRGRLS